MLNLVDKTLRHAAQHATRASLENSFFSNLMLLGGAAAAMQVRQMARIRELSDAGFKVFSQWDEDGIVEWLVHQNGPMPESFVEFGVEDFREANLRHLLISRNWRGMVIDGSPKNIEVAKRDAISWRHDFTAVASFVTAENINGLISDAGFSGEIGILSVDIDGNDYWLWKAIECVNPHFVIVEYNSAFGDLHPLTIPYRPDFTRTEAHFSNLYWGASIEGFCALGRERGYTLLGSNRAGSNAFFVRNDRLPRFADRLDEMRARPHRFRESRDDFGQLSYVSGQDRSKAIADQPVVDVVSGKTGTLGSFGELYTPRWAAMLRGQVE